MADADAAPTNRSSRGDLTQGSIGPTLLRFALPTLCVTEPSWLFLPGCAPRQDDPAIRRHESDMQARLEMVDMIVSLDDLNPFVFVPQTIGKVDHCREIHYKCRDSGNRQSA